MGWKPQRRASKTPLVSLGPTAREVGENPWSPLEGAAGEEEP